MMQFGPQDGFLYIGMGDGGGSNDVHNNGQNLNSLLGAILRIDVDNPINDLEYGIPSGNPFAGNSNGWQEEIWAYGLRNPWRFSIDSLTNQLWAGDVGQNRKEEVDLISAGDNLGWPRMEGFECFNKNDRLNPLPSCDQTGLTLPVIEYGRSEGRSITGGYVYRGQMRPALYGAYIYGDFATGNIWMLMYQDGQLSSNELLLQSGFPVSSFGVDEQNELYIINYSGTIHRFSKDPATSVKTEPENTIKEFELTQNFPNPFNPETNIRFVLRQPMQIEIVIFDLNGRLVNTLAAGYFRTGSHQVRWNGLDAFGNPAATGIYYCRMSTARAAETRKMLLLR
jgi:hypothetical protein